MIGLFDSGHGGLTVYESLSRRFPGYNFLYLGDHANAPYGNRSSEEIFDLTRTGVEVLFERGCRLVILACNTATAIAGRKLQQEWLPYSSWDQHNVLGIIAPTVEAATQTPWAVTTPQYPQKYDNDLIAIYATNRTVQSGVFAEEIRKRCPNVRIVQQSCPELAGAIESGALSEELDELVKYYVRSLIDISDGAAPDKAILGCTHYPLVEDLFYKHLPQSTRLLSQPVIVADSLEDYLVRHPQYAAKNDAIAPEFLTTGDALRVTDALVSSWKKELLFKAVQ